MCYSAGRFFSTINELSEINGVIYHKFQELSNIESVDYLDNILLFIPDSYFFKNFEKNWQTLISFYSNITSKRVLYLVDSFSLLSLLAKLPAHYILDKICCFFDNIYSFSMHDHFAYNFSFYPTISTKRNDIQYKSNSTYYDVFFCGIDGGRLNILLDVAEKLSKLGITYKFIVREPSKAGTNLGNIYFIDAPISYKEIINYVVHSNVLLCINRAVATDPPLSYYESIMYNKKLLTNCSIIKKMPFTKKNNVKYLEEDFNYDFFKTPADGYDYPGDFFSLSNLINRIRNDDLLGYISKYYVPIQEQVIYYHFSDVGWVQSSAGQMMLQKGHRLESLYFYGGNDCSLNVSVFQKNKGWLTSFPFVGISGQSLPILAIKIVSLSSNYKVSYKVSLNNIGWLQEFENGGLAGYECDSLNNLHDECYINGICISLKKT